MDTCRGAGSFFFFFFKVFSFLFAMPIIQPNPTPPTHICTLRYPLCIGNSFHSCAHLAITTAHQPLITALLPSPHTTDRFWPMFLRTTTIVVVWSLLQSQASSLTQTHTHTHTHTHILIQTRASSSRLADMLNQSVASSQLLSRTVMLTDIIRGEIAN